MHATFDACISPLGGSVEAMCSTTVENQNYGNQGISRGWMLLIL